MTDEELRQVPQKKKLDRDIESIREMTVRITPENAESRIQEAIHTLIHCWDEWESQSSQDAQVSQKHDAYFAGMSWQIGTVLQGMVFDEDATQ